MVLAPHHREAVNACKGRHEVREKDCCFCLMVLGAELQHPEDDRWMRCCWCGEMKLHAIVRTPVEGHGPRRHNVTYVPKD